MTPLSVIITIAAYFAILFTVSYIAGRKADNAGFFVGNRKSSWYVVAFAMVGSAISGVTYVSVPGMVAASSFGYLQMVLGFIAGQLIIAYLLVPLFYKMNLVSIYEYLENRFGMSSYRTGAWFFFISKMLGAAVRLFLVCLTLQLLVFGTFRTAFPAERGHHGGTGLVVHFPRWREVPYLDRLSEDILLGGVGRTLHLVHRFRPQSVIYRYGKHHCRQ